jgi:gas vesicle protein
MTEEMATNKGSSLIPFLVGCLAGAGAALLLAPKAGKEVRDDIKRLASTAQDRVTHAIDEGKEIYSEGKTVISNAIEAGKNAYVKEKEKWERAA